MCKLHTTMLTVLAIFALVASASTAPQLIDYQGYLEDDNGNPITDTLSMTFTIYDDSSGTTSKWTETQSSVEILGGLFNVTLGSSTAMPDTVFNQDERWLHIEVDGNDVDPPTRIVSTAYSMRVNTVDGAAGGTISGDLTVDGKGNFGDDNTCPGTYAFVSGEDNLAAGDHSTVGGYWNTGTGLKCVVAGGEQNEASGGWSAVGGGYGHTASDSFATVSGGKINIASGKSANIGGGYLNTASGDHSAVAGGLSNLAQGTRAVVGGGTYDTASGGYATVPGGAQNKAAGNFSFAAGKRAKANHSGAFVWADNTNSDFASSRSNQFRARANGGARFDVNNSRWVEMYDDGSNLINTSTGARLTLGGVWTNASDRNLKENFTPVNPEEILQKVASLPITRWNYKSQSDQVTHIGPVAQDFYALFGLGGDDKTISTIDPAGVALAAIQQLYCITQELEKKTARIDNLEVQISELQAQVAILLAERQTKSADGKAYSAVVGK